MKTITIDNKKYIPARIVMLPTEIGIIGKQIHTGHLALPDEFEYKEFYKGGNTKPQHLYLVCDLPIEVNDWYIAHTIERCCCKEEANDITDKCKKVIATTDSSLKYGDDIPTIIRYKSLPQFPKPFIEEFVERQGKNVDVLVEAEEYIVQSFGLATVNGYEEPLTDYRIKLNPDNTVNIIFK